MLKVPHNKGTHHIFKWQIRSKGKNNFIRTESTDCYVIFHDLATVSSEVDNDLDIEYLGNISTEYLMSLNILNMIFYQRNSCLGNLWIWYVLNSLKDTLN